MKGYSKRITSKITKLPPEKIESIFDTLYSENENLISILESLNTGLMICDKNWNLQLANKAVDRFIPNKARKETTQSIKIWDCIDDEDISEFIKTCAKKQKLNVSEEFTTVSNSGLSRIVSVTIQGFVQNSRLTGFIIKIDDITEKKSQEVLLRRIENLTSLTNLAASVAHEIKNPLGSISIHIQLIQKAIAKARSTDGKLPDEKFTDKYLAIVNEEIDRLNKIIVDFLFAVRPISAQIESVDINKLIESFIDLIVVEAEKQKISVKTELESGIPHLLIDSKLFRQILMNLGQNAIAAMKDGGKILVSTQKKADKVLVTFSDTGIGMDKQTLSRIFEPYYTTKVTGTGLGLTMVYKIIKEFGGNIDVHSEVGEGTIFVITLPIPQTEKHLIEA